MWQPVLPFSNMFVAAALALIPMAWIFIGMLNLRLPLHKVGAIALVIAWAEALFIWKMPAGLTLQAVLEGAAIGILPILWVVFAAIFTYNITVASGSMENIKHTLSGISKDGRIQVLIMAFAFGGFLEAAAGFGTAVAIPAGILAALGFEPLFAAVVCLTANTIPVAFGAVGVPVVTLAKLTDIPVHTLTINIALQLLPFVLVLPLFLVVVTTGSFRGIQGVGMISVIAGLAFAIGQTLTAWLIGPELSAVIGSLGALLVLIVFAKIFPVKHPWHSHHTTREASRSNKRVGFINGLRSWSPYALILLLVLLTRLLPSLKFLDEYPFTLEYQFFHGAGGKPVSFSLVTNPGTLIIISALLGGLIQGLSLKALLGTVAKTLKQIGKTIVTVISIVALARVMGYSGMISAIASALSGVTGSFFPLVSPFIGALGTFITGSDTSSNVLFGELQKQTAIQINAKAAWITAANASGATAGKMVSPQSIAIATSATGLSGREGEILKRTLKYSLAFVILLGLLVYGVNLMHPVK